MYMYVYVYICVDLSLYIYRERPIHICVYIYIYIYIYMCNYDIVLNMSTVISCHAVTCTASQTMVYRMQLGQVVTGRNLEYSWERV